MRFLCPNCHRELEVPDEAAGTAGSCRLCGASIIAPMGPGQDAALARAPGAPPPDPGTPSAAAPYGRVEPFTILSESWTVLWGNFGPIAISCYAALVAVALVLLPTAGPIWFSAMEGMTPGSQPVMPPLIYIIVAVVVTALSPLIVGPLYVIDDILTKGGAEISAMLRGFQQYRDIAIFTFLVYALPTALFGLLASAVAGTGRTTAVLVSILSSVVSFVIYATLLPGIMEIVDRGADAATALSSSWEFTKGHRWRILLAWILLSIAGAAGVIVCCVGQFVTQLMTPVGLVLIYRDIRGLRGGAGGTTTTVGRANIGASAGRGGSKGPLLLIVGLVGIIGLFVVAAILFPVFAKARQRAATTQCLQGMKTEQAALMKYARAHGGRLPDAANWENEIKANLPAGFVGCPKVTGASGYALNSALAGRPLPTGPNAAGMVLLFDGGTGTANQSGGPTIAQERHGNGIGITVCFANGQVRVVGQGDLANLAWTPGTPTNP